MEKFFRVLQEYDQLNGEDLEGPTATDSDTDFLGFDVPDDSGIGIYILIVVFLLILGGIGTFAFYYFVEKIRHSRLIDEYSTNPEAQIQTQELTHAEKVNLTEWQLNPVGPNNIVSCKTERTKLGKEEFFKVEFLHIDRKKKSIITNMPLEKNKDNVYFEVEILEIQPGVNVSIGYVTKQGYDKAKFPGENEGGVGLQSTNGSVWLNGKEAFNNEFNIGFGDTLGIGYTFASGRVWVFSNGILLNEANPGSPMGKIGDPYKKDKKEEIEKLENETKKRKIALPIDIELYPIIGADGPCVLQLNIGGAVFRTFNKEIAKGLL